MVDELVERIVAESDVDEDTVRDRIQEKLEELSGLVSEEGAAHLIAREEGVELSEASEKELKVENVVPGMNRVDLKAQVVDITDVHTFDQDDGGTGRVQNVVLGDETGTLRMSLWNEQLEIAEKIDVGDAIQLAAAYSREDNRGNAELRIGDSTQIQRIDEEIAVASRPQNGGSAEEVPVNRVRDENRAYTVTGTIVELYAENPFYQACPECNKKVEEAGDGYTCNEHGDVDPNPTLILSAIIDDGHGNIRSVFFRDQARQLLDVDEPLDGDVERVQERAEAVKGRDAVVTGRARYNDFFSRTELICNDVSFKTAEDLLKPKLSVN